MAEDGPSPEPAYVSTGALPPRERIQALLDAALARFADNADGKVASYIPALATADSQGFGIALATAEGEVVKAGQCDRPFSLQSISKPFAFALVAEAIGLERARAEPGVNATGMGFDSVLAVELGDRQLTNPMVNAGAIATASLVPGDTPDGRFAFLREGLSRFAGRPLAVDETVYRSEAATNRRNRGIAMLLAILCIAGQYQRSGDWLFDIGLPGKSGVAGGVITIAPGKGGLGVWSPPLDAAGTSVRGKAVTRYLSDALGLNLFASEPARTG